MRLSKLARHPRCPLAAIGLVLLAGTTASAQLASKPEAKSLKLQAAEIDTAAGKPLTVTDVTHAKGGERYILQLDGPLTPLREKTLHDAGVTILDYVPDDAVIVNLKDADPAKAAAIPFVRWQNVVERPWKVDPTLGARQFETAERRELDRRGLTPVLITLFKDADQSEITAVSTSIAALQGATVHRRASIADNPVIVATIRFDDIPRVDAFPQVQWIEEAPEITERDSSANWIVQSNIPNTNSLWDKGLTGLGQIIGFLDSSLDWQHCALSDVNPIGPSHRKILAYNWRLAVTTFHGTHVVGLAVGDDGTPDELRGVAYQSKIVFNTTPSFLESDAFERLELHHQQGARIHSNSWGENDISTYTGLVRGVDDFCWKYEDSLVLVAGRNGSPGTPVSRPENAKNVIAVAASGDDPGQDNPCSGPTGPTLDGRRKPDIFAPGCNLISASAGSACNTTAATGTSMATPLVSGTAALMRQYFVDGYYPSGTPSNPSYTPSSALLRAMIVNSGQDMTYFADYPSDGEGWGRLNAEKVLYFPGDTSRLFVADRRNNAGLTTGLVAEHTFTVTPGSDPLRITLAWTEPPAAAGASVAQVNDLDLEVVSPTATTYLGNVFSAGESATGGSADHANSIEQVHVLAPAAGVWTVRVKATAINVGQQGYAIAVTGPVDAGAAPLQVAVENPPTLVSSNTLTPVDVTIKVGDENIVSAALYSRINAGSFTSSPLMHVLGDQYTAELPPAQCGDIIEYYAAVTGDLTGSNTSPPAAPGTLFSAAVGAATSTTIFSENFDAGVVPAGWTASGLWKVTNLCQLVDPGCSSGQWAYFGQIAGLNACTYVGSGRQQGNLTAPTVALPAINPGERLVLRFCQSLERENFATVDLAQLLIDGSPVIQYTAATPTWFEREYDLSSRAGQSITLAWRFDSVDGFSNNFNGWKIDNVRIERLGTQCTPPPVCLADFNNDLVVNGSDLSILLSNFGSTTATHAQGDANGDGFVNAADLSVLLSAFNQPCP